jgi:serine/tyrosine/threonine adenylyltransferase
MPFQFDNSYLTLPNGLFTETLPTPVNNPTLVLFNKSLANELGIDTASISEKELVNYLSGNTLIEGSTPIAQAYAGHQFGHFNKLGDGRAILLGEHITPKTNRFDIQLKGAGSTAYSRNGDGRATLSSMLREYVLSEAMFFLGISTTRSLAVVSTGETVYRNDDFPGAVLTRIAASHIRVGTFEYVRQFQNKEVLEEFTNYTIQRHYPELASAENPALAFLQKVMDNQINLIVEWMRVGFIHGVMNTDNMSIAGETIDYGPCAFMNSYIPNKTYSSIDREGRYAFDNQPNIALWNLTRLAETLLPLIDEDKEASIEKAKAVLQLFSLQFNSTWLAMMRKKIGIIDAQEQDVVLIDRLLNWMHANKSDYTNTFIQLSVPTFSNSPIYQQVDFTNWLTDWKTRINATNGLPAESLKLMQQSNPAYILRNQLVESALQQAQGNGDYTEFNKLLAILNKPYSYEGMNAFYQHVPEEVMYRTYCGT